MSKIQIIASYSLIIYGLSQKVMPHGRPARRSWPGWLRETRAFYGRGNLPFASLGLATHVGGRGRLGRDGWNGLVSMVGRSRSEKTSQRNLLRIDMRIYTCHSFVAGDSTSLHVCVFAMSPNIEFKEECTVQVCFQKPN